MASIIDPIRKLIDDPTGREIARVLLCEHIDRTVARSHTKQESDELLADARLVLEKYASEPAAPALTPPPSRQIDE